MLRSLLMIAVLMTVFYSAGCAAHPKLETRSYLLQQRKTEESLIKSVLDDQFARIGPDKLVATVNSYSGTMEVLNITQDNVAVVRTTPQGHAAIRKALEELRKQFAQSGV